MTGDRRTFLQWLGMALALSVAGFYAAYVGVPQRVWHYDVSHVTSVIALVVLGSVAHLGRLSWLLSPDTVDDVVRASAWDAYVYNFCWMVGILGTTVGLSLQTDGLAQGLAPISTSLFTTMVGVCGSLVVYTMYTNLRVGVAAVRGVDP